MTRLILNGKAAQLPQVREAVFASRDAGANMEVLVTWEKGDAARLAEQAGYAGRSRVIAGGGDGTVNEVVNGLMRLTLERRPALGILPLGSANDLAMSLDLPQTPGAALAAALRLPSRPVDVARLDDRYFLNMTTGGFGAEVTSSTPKSLKRLLGGGAYSLIGALKAWQHHPYAGHLSWAGGQCDASLFVLAMGNGTQAGGGQRLTPEARLDDGLLDILLVRDFASLRDMVTMRRELLERPREGLFVETFRTPWLRFEGVDGLPLTLDGEPLCRHDFHVEVESGALELVVPGDCPLFSHGSNGAGESWSRAAS
ncbi:lipid kinase YegS [Halomonas eurihalina]|uniref:Probable lipid kinase YegS-like n=1 Tax=Halomonas eurihalina TaxID=42566 RepID=A0A5D9D7Z0_HALER|nr:lipid kinase YegS [Halomonas eurihalina]MDR5860559.1 lipid kinase YegS [Halomonas eurihalina]TZG40208.1 lipid kinase YegS [Halomonas eurihalina]